MYLGEEQPWRLETVPSSGAHTLSMHSTPVMQPTACISWASQAALVVKNLPANAGDVRDVGLVPGSGRSPGEGSGTPLQYSCRENPMDSGVLWATFHRVTKSQMRLKRISTHNADIQKDGV